MTSLPTRQQTARRELLVNWLALLGLIALGVVWPGDESSGAAAPRAHSAAHCAPSTLRSTPNTVQSTRTAALGTAGSRPQARAPYAMP